MNDRIFRQQKPVFLYERDTALDPNLSFAAKGLLAYVIASEDDLSEPPLGLTAQETDALVAELIATGHLEHTEDGDQ